MASLMLAAFECFQLDFAVASRVFIVRCGCSVVIRSLNMLAIQLKELATQGAFNNLAEALSRLDKFARIEQIDNNQLLVQSVLQHDKLIQLVQDTGLMVAGWYSRLSRR